MVGVDGCRWPASSQRIEPLKKKAKKLLITLLKIGISVAILAYLVWNATRPQPDGQNVFANLVSRPKHWGWLAGAWGMCFSAVMLTFIRWWYLVRALEVPLRLRNGLRIGFVGYLFNLAPMGIVGGDLLKAFLLAHEYPEGRAKAFASVAVDRLIGLYMLFVVATAAILATGFWYLPDPKIRWICHFTFVVTAVGGVGIALLMIPGVTGGKVTRTLSGIPRIGHAVASLIDALRLYRRRPGVIAIATLMSIAVHSMFATGVYFIARGLPGKFLTLAEHFVVSPLSASTGVLPLPMGPFEAVLDFLYTCVSDGAIPSGQGLVVALTYRLICILIAVIGICYYLGSRAEVTEVMHEAEEEPAG